MYLQSLTLKGFKSFAERTRILLEPGVTSIVGPNGSGKSNITDAVLWVLGEQSAKSLRGQSMEDVIFAGSSARRSVGMAEVDLVLDNSDGLLPLEFNEVTITRRMFRSGESEYLVNQTPSRLMDIQDLLSDAGLGRDTHSIISQGRIEEVLDSKPEDRRTLIEEAAGIRKHKKRKERALRKLRSMDGHVDAARSVIREIGRQLRPLEKQADRARRHEDLAAELHEIELVLAVDDLRDLHEEWDALESREKEQDSELELLRLRLEEKETELERFKKLLEEKGLFVGDLSEQRRRLQAVLERLNSGLLLLEEKGKNLIARLSDLRAKVHHGESRLAARRAELDQLIEERGGLDASLQSEYQRLGELRREAERIKKQRLSSEEDLEAVTGSLNRTRKELEDLRGDLTAAERSMSEAELETEMLGERLTALDERGRDLGSRLSARRNRVDHLDKATARTRKDLGLAEADVDKRVRVLESRRREAASAKDRVDEIRAEVRGLEEVHRAFETASPALAWALSKQDEIDGFVGPLADALTPAVEVEELVEHVLGADLFAIVVREPEDAVRLFDALSDTDAGEISILPANAMASASHPADAPGERLIERIDCDDAARPALEGLIGDVRVVDRLDEAIAAARAHVLRFATPDGHVAWPNGKLSYGPAVDDAAGVLARKRHINELKDAFEHADGHLGDMEAAVCDGEEALAAAQQDALDLGRRLATQSAELASLREEVGRLEESHQEIERERDQISKRMSELAERTSRERPVAERLRTSISQTEARVEGLTEALEQRRAERDARYRDEAAVSAKLSECQVDIATVSEREVHLKRRVGAISAEISELEETLERSRLTEEGLELLRERIHPVHELYEELLEHAELWAHRLKDRARFEQSDSESLRQTIDDAQDSYRAIQEEIDGLKQGISSIHVEKGQLEVRISQAAGRIVETMGVPLERALEAPPVEDRPATEEHAHTLRKRLEHLGPVNPIAVEEFAALEERRAYLDAQLGDLLETKRGLQKVVGAIDRKMRDRFLETFEAVDGSFQRVFAVLFPGGTAGLELTDPDDPAETGVEVVAQPRGKKLSRMSLMSGGEKSLVAIALLFALYHTRPSPFYILDEVEAALDDVNLRRFLGLIESLRGHTQFVVITHQRRTMETADLLYGVSMQADGVSKVVSQRLGHAGEDKETSDEHAVV